MDFYYFIHFSYLTQISCKKDNVISSGYEKVWVEKKSLAVYMQTPISTARCSFCNAIRFEQRKIWEASHILLSVYHVFILENRKILYYDIP